MYITLGEGGGGGLVCVLLFYGYYDTPSAGGPGEWRGG
jgi:hypothetical protein